MEKPKDIFGFLDGVRKTSVSDEQIYNKVSVFLEQKARESCVPFRGTFELTPLCNLDCKMCYVHLNEVQMRGRKLLSSDKWICLMNQAIEAGMSKATLTGGECLTYPYFDDVYLFLKSKGILITVKTNGVLLDSNRIDFFRNNPPSALLVSLYGNSDKVYEKVTGSRVFWNVLNNIQMAKKANLPVTIMITPNSYMGETIKETIQFVKGLDIPYVINSTLMTPRLDTQKEKEEYDLTIDQYIDILLFDSAINNFVLQKNESAHKCELFPKEDKCKSQYELSGIKCGAGKSSFSITWDGYMCPCILMDNVKDNPIENGFASSWEHINREMNRFPTFVKCKQCAYSQACAYCAAENEKMGSKYLLDNMWCQRTWKMIESGLISHDYRCGER